jgi:predicted ATPase
MLTKLTLEGFKSFRKLELELRPLNVLIGANGAGKSNFISAFRLLNAMVEGRLQRTIAEAGGSDAFLRYGKKQTRNTRFHLEFDTDVVYDANLLADSTDSLTLNLEGFYRPITDGKSDALTTARFETPTGRRESLIWAIRENTESHQDYQDYVGVIDNIRSRLQSIQIHHMPDTSSTAAIKGTGRINDNLKLRSDGENLAAMLFLIRLQNLMAYHAIRDVIRNVAPYFDDFQLRPNALNLDTIRLEWREENSDYPFLARDLSDGTLRFMALVTLLLQPNPPAITVIDEPELGLHPFAIEELAGLLRVASSRTQLIVATQSPQLIAALEPEDVIVADRENGETTLRRLDANALEGWLEEYTLGELWQKNILGGVVNPNPVRSRSGS